MPMGDALDVANTIRDEFHRINALAALAPHLWPGLREQMLDEALAAAAKTILGHEAFDYFGGRRSRSHSPARALAALAPHLSPKQLGEALAAAKAVHHEHARLSALAALTPYLSPKQRSETANAIEASYYLYHDSLAVAALAPYLAPKRRRYWLGQALARPRPLVTRNMMQAFWPRWRPISRGNNSATRSPPSRRSVTRTPALALWLDWRRISRRSGSATRSRVLKLSALGSAAHAP